MMRCILVLLALLLSAGCAVKEPIAPDYSGPTAYIRDSSVYEDKSSTQLFVVVAVDDQEVSNSIGATSSASRGQGFRITTEVVGRKIPARPLKITLRGTHATAAPIQALFSMARGTYLSVEGTVDFAPEPNGLYAVKGTLAQDGSSVWIEDLNTNKVVSERVRQRAR